MSKATCIPTFALKILSFNAQLKSHQTRGSLSWKRRLLQSVLYHTLGTCGLSPFGTALYLLFIMSCVHLPLPELPTCLACPAILLATLFLTSPFKSQLS